MIKAFVEHTEDELVLDTEEWGIIYMGNIDHSLIESQTIWIEVVEKMERESHSYEVGQAYKNGLSDPKIVYVYYEGFKNHNDQTELH